MNPRLNLGLLVLLGAASARATGADTELEGLESAWSQAYLRHDLAAIERLLADEFVGVDGRGMVSRKADELAEAKLPEPGTEALGMRIVDEAISNVRVQTYGSTAVIHADNHVDAVLDGKPLVLDYRRTTVWVQRDGRWQCVAFHASRLGPPPK